MDTIICGCTGTTKGTIVEAIKAGATTVDAVGEQTKAGTVCGSCKMRIQDVINEVNA